MIGFKNDVKETQMQFLEEENRWTVYSNISFHMERLIKIAGDPFHSIYENKKMISGWWHLNKDEIAILDWESAPDFSELFNLEEKNDDTKSETCCNTCCNHCHAKRM